MGILDFFSSFSGDSISNDISGNDINPANGLPIMGGIDIEGNTFGTSSSTDLFDSNCSIDNSFNDIGCGSMFDN